MVFIAGFGETWKRPYTAFVPSAAAVLLVVVITISKYASNDEIVKHSR